MKKNSMHVLCHTHWDREWYQPFQEYRVRLVYQTELMLDIMDRDPNFYFHFDGATAWIDDFLDIKPQHKERLEKYIKEGRIIMGPWYVMPDELLLSGESLVRNLEKGTNICRLMGTGPMPVGYVTDIFGHISQFPQIIKEFGIDTAFLHRGTGCEDDEKQEMLWEGADGTRVLLIKVFPDTGYQDFLVKRWVSDEELLKYEQRKLETNLTGILFALDGNDHTPPRSDMKEETARFTSVFKEINAFPSDMLTFLKEEKEALSKIDQSTMKLFKGELRHPSKQGAWNELFNGTASARLNLKQRNDTCEYKLARISDPLNAFACLYGNADESDFLNKSWNYLIQNHPHDSIVGCSQDQVHRDMLYRFDQSEIIADAMAWESICSFPISTKASDRNRCVTVYNQSAVPTGPITRFEFDVPMADLAEGKQPILLDSDGNQIEFETEKTEKAVWGKPIMQKTADAYGTSPDVWVERCRCQIAAKVSIPPFGYKTFTIGYGERQESIKAKADFIENEYIKLSYSGDKGLELTDKINKAVYANTFLIEDCGDTGTGWDHVYPENDTRIISDLSKSDAEIKCEASPLSQTMTVKYNMSVPAGLAETGRSEEKTLCGIKLIFVLDKGSKYLKVTAEINNTAKNHRMRILLPTGCITDHYFADTAFDVVEREIALPDTIGWKEQAMPWAPFKNICGITSKNRGLAVMTKGLCEAGAAPKSGGTLALTLFRGFSETLYGYHTEDSQLLGYVKCEFALLPCTDSTSYSDIMKTAEGYKMPIYALTSAPKEGILPDCGTFIKLEGDVILSSLRQKGKGWEIRIFNPESKSAPAEISLPRDITKADITDFSGNKKSNADFCGKSVKLTLKPKEISTVYIEM